MKNPSGRWRMRCAGWVACVLIGVMPAQAQSFADLFKAMATQAQEGQRGAMESVCVLKPDGMSYTEFTSTVVSGTLQLWVKKGTKPSDYLYFYPQNPEIRSVAADQDAFILDSGYSQIVEGRMTEKYLTQNPDGTFTYRSWDGTPGNVGGVRTTGSYLSSGFSRWNVAWIIPDNVEIVRYEANVRGRWSFKAPVLSFYASDVNHVWYTVTYRVRQATVTSMETLP